MLKGLDLNVFFHHQKQGVWVLRIARHLPDVLNPASGKSVIETCITPVFLYS